MKKILSLFICICMLCSALVISAAEVTIELDSLKYDEYMRGETIFVSGQTNAYVTLGLYYPESYGSSAKYIMTYSPAELADGIELETDTDDKLWPDGVWTIVVQSGDVSETLEFTLCETVDRTEEETEAPTKKPNTNGDVPTVTPITPDKTKIELKVGDTEKVNITTSAKSLQLEIEDDSVVSASLSGNTLTVKALKRGTSTIWIKTSNNYANINVTVNPKSSSNSSGNNSVEKPTEKPTEEPTEAPTETPTEEPTEESTEAPTEEPTEEPTEKVTENPFTDLPDNHWAKESVLFLYDKGVINGMDEDTFAPDEYITRAQFVTMLCKAFNLKNKTGSSPFGDVSEDDWYFTTVMAAYDNGITQGDTAGNFNPNSLVTRQDMATLAHRAAVNNGIVFTLTSIIKFSDHDAIKDYAVEAVYTMRSAGVINGMTNTTFEPLGNATRAQAAHIIAKLLEL